MGHGKSWLKSKTQDKSTLFQNKYDSNHTWQVSFILAEDQPLLCVCLSVVLYSAPQYSLIWRHHRCYWRASKSRPLLGTYPYWAMRDLYYHVTPGMIQNLGFWGLVWRPLVSHLLWQFALIGVLRTCSKQDPRPRNIKGKHPSI